MCPISTMNFGQQKNTECTEKNLKSITTTTLGGSLFWVSHWFRKCSLTFYFQFQRKLRF